MNLEEIIKALPSVLDEEAWQWFRREYQFWKSYEDLVKAFRLQYSFEDVQERLRKELEDRTQGPSKTISTYLCKVRDLLDQLKPPLTLHEQLDRVYQKLHSSYRMRFDRKDFETFPELQKLGKKEELRRAQDRAYKPPPSLAESSFPSSAYVPTRTPRPGKVAMIEPPGVTETTLLGTQPTEIAPVSSPPHSAAQQRNKRTGRSTPKKPFNKKNNRRSPSRGRNSSNVTVEHPSPEPPEIQVVPPKLKQEEMQRRKEREPCFRCGQVGHWSRECVNAAVCRNCGTPNATVKTCTKCNAKAEN